LESAVKMNVMDGVREVNAGMSKKAGEKFGADGVEISVHANSAPDHEDIQGRQFTNEEYEKLQSGRPFKDVTGRHFAAIKRPIGMWNCGHYVFEIIVGVSEPAHGEKELNRYKAKNIKGFEYEGHKYTGYEAEQMQNKIKNEWRKTRGALEIAREAGDSGLANEYQRKMTILQHHYAKFTKAAENFNAEPLTNFNDSATINTVLKTKPSEFKIYEDVKNGADIQQIAGTGFINNQYQPNKGYEDKILKRIAQEQGFDALPNVIDKNEIDKRIAYGEPELFRGVSDEWYAEQLQNREYFAGTGVNGNGTYAAGYSDKAGRNNAINTAFVYTQDKGVVLRMTLDKSAKVANYKDIERELYNGALKNTNYQALKDPLKILEADFGRYAAMLGYDAIFVEDKKFYVVLNRTKLNIEKTFYKDKGDLII
jgi:hypothetical protein